MAIYYSTTIQSNIIGDNPEMTILQESVPLKQLMNSLGTEKLLLRSLDLWANNKIQMVQPMVFNRTTADGKSEYITKFPQLDSFQSDSSLNNYDLGEIEFDENGEFQYEILPNSIVKLTLNFDEDARNSLSQLTQFGIDAEDGKLDYLINPEKGEYKEDEIISTVLEDQDKKDETGKADADKKISDAAKKPATTKKEEKKPAKDLNWWWIVAIAGGIYVTLQLIDKKIK